MRLNVVVIFLNIVLWGWMWGIGGAILAVPMLAVIKIVCSNIERLKPIATLISGEPVNAIVTD